MCPSLSSASCRMLLATELLVFMNETAFMLFLITLQLFLSAVDVVLTGCIVRFRDAAAGRAIEPFGRSA